MGKGQDRHRARRALGYTYMRLDGYRARQTLVGLSAHCANSYIPHVQHIIEYTCAVGCRYLHSVHSALISHARRVRLTLPILDFMY